MYKGKVGLHKKIAIIIFSIVISTEPFVISGGGIETHQTLEQPDLEFLLSEVFGVVQTGKRYLAGLSVKFKGSPGPTFKSNRSHSTLFGQGLFTARPGHLYLDIAGNGLNVGGTTTTVTSFTFGAFVYVPQTNDQYMAILAVHNYDSPTGTDDWSYRYRIQPAIKGTLDATNLWSIWTVGTGADLSEVAIALEKRSGWLHVAFTFDVNTGIMSTFYDGSLVATQNKLGWVAFGTSGRCPA